ARRSIRAGEVRRSPKRCVYPKAYVSTVVEQRASGTLSAVLHRASSEPGPRSERGQDTLGVWGTPRRGALSKISVDGQRGGECRRVAVGRGRDGPNVRWDCVEFRGSGVGLSRYSVAR